MAKLLIIGILALPLVEIAGFVLVGQLLGVLGTLALVLISALVGAALLRRQGLATLNSLRDPSRPAAGRLAVRPVFDGVCRALAGLLLMVPGVFTDLIALLLLLPPVRGLLFRRLAAAGTVDMSFAAAARPKGPFVIEGEFRTVDDQPPAGGEALPPVDQSRWRPDGQPPHRP